MIKLAIFDLDGTLVDSIQDLAISANHVIKSYDRDEIPLDHIRDFIGDGVRRFVQGLAGDRHEDEEFVDKVLGEFNAHYEHQLVKNTRFYPGAAEFLTKFLEQTTNADSNLHIRRKMGVVTNKGERQARIILDHLVPSLGLGDAKNLFVEIYGGDTFDVKKPDPKPLLKMMEKAGVTPDETIMIGDSRQDLEAARNAGTHFLAVSFGYNTVDVLKGYGASRFFNHFDELLELIEKYPDAKP